MTTLKKVILFLFGIVLVVFGNKAAINTIFGDKGKTDLQEKSPESSSVSKNEPIIIEEDSVVTSASDEKLLSEKVKPQAEKPKSEKVEAKAKPQPKVKVEKPKEEKKEEVKETPKTTVESDSSESATATE